jgi:hypothetical protein
MPLALDRVPGRRVIARGGPDLPVFKRTKAFLPDVVTNDGLHVHGMIIANRWGRLTDCLDRGQNQRPAAIYD